MYKHAWAQVGTEAGRELKWQVQIVGMHGMPGRCSPCLLAAFPLLMHL